VSRALVLDGPRQMQLAEQDSPPLQAGEARLRSVFEEAGFTRFRRAAETPVNLILEARP